MRLNNWLVRSMAVAVILMATVAAGQAQPGPSDLQGSASALMIWTDKYVYQPNEAITLRWTARANGDSTPYTLVAYRQNNQTGEKFYFPAHTADPTDTFGNPAGRPFTVVYLGDVSKGVVIGQGGWLRADLRAPSELGMHTFVLQLRDATGSRVVKSAYFKIGIVEGFENLSGNIDSARTLSNTKAYRLAGLVNVRSTLTIEPGTFVLGQPGSQPPSVLVITQNGQLLAEGTRSRPIIMTSSLPFGQRKPGDWGGLILLGKAPTNWPTGFGNIEGLPATPDTQYGGTDPNHSCGRLRYVRVEYAGAEFQPNEEVNSFTFGGCGKGTVADHLQARYGLDDLFEWFGGTSDAKYLVGTYGRDDYLDGQIGWTGRIQHVIAVAGQDVPGNRGIEMDNNQQNQTLTPLSRPQMYNMTFIGAGDMLTQGFDEGVDVAGIWLRRGTGGAYNNTIIQNWISNGFTIRDNATLTAVDNKALTVNGILMWDNGKGAGKTNTVSSQVSGTGNLAEPFMTGTRGEARNVVVADPALRRPFFLSDPDFRPRSGSAAFFANWIQPPDDGFFDQWATWSGAFGDVDWTEEWTCYHQEDDVRP